MSVLLAQADAVRIPLADASVDLVIGSPPYGKQRTYGRAGIARDLSEWVDWMLAVTAEALRVSRGLVLWVCSGWTRGVKGAGLGCYEPGPEGLLWEWHRRGGFCWRPNFWRRVGISGSGHRVWYRSDVEYVLAFKRPEPLPFAAPTANGHPPKYAHSGGATNRRPDGKRNNRGADGINRRKAFKNPALADPGNLFRTHAGRNHMGSHLAHENEAPFPEAVPERFIKSHCPEGGIVLDPFNGSGSTLAAARRWGRHGIGLDLRRSQCELARRRLADQETLFDSLMGG